MTLQSIMTAFKILSLWDPIPTGRANCFPVLPIKNTKDTNLKFKNNLKTATSR